MIPHERLTTPVASPGLLVEPPDPQPGPPAPGAALLLGRPLLAWRGELRAELDLAAPVILSGHQPEFFHAGVLAKTLAAAFLAERLGGAAVFLIADSDTPRSARLSIPQPTAGGLRRVDVAIPGHDLRAPYEFQPAQPRAAWLDFLSRVAMLHSGYESSLLRSFAAAWTSAAPGGRTGEPSADAAQPLDYVEAFARAHAAALATLGVTLARTLRMSALTRTRAFRMFVAHHVMNSAAGAAAYNAAIRTYRERHRVRTRGRPAPLLSTAGGRIEAPLWACRPGGARRRLFVEALSGEIRLWAEAEPIGTLPHMPQPDAELAEHPGLRALVGLSPHELSGAAGLHKVVASDLPGYGARPATGEADLSNGWRIRPRALTLSGFVRLLLSDLFIHGIGGAKYDEMTDDYLRDFAGVTPAPLACVSATLRLPLPVRGQSVADRAAARRAARDIRFNPQRYLSNLPEPLLREREEWIRRSERLMREAPRDHVARRAAFDALRRLNQDLLARDPWRPAQLHERVEAIRAAEQDDAIALDREYFFALHPVTALADLAARLRTRLSL
jgi:hypothetical protein